MTTARIRSWLWATILLAGLVGSARSAHAACGTTVFVTNTATAIQNAVNAIPASLASDYCIFLATGTYIETVTIAGHTTNNFRIVISTYNPGVAGVTLMGANGGGNAVFAVQDASVTLNGMTIRPTGVNVNYGILTTGLNDIVSNVDIMDNGVIPVAGIQVSSWATVSNSSAANTTGLYGVVLTGYGNSVVASTAAAGNAGGYALLVAAATGNAITSSYFSNSNGVAGYLAAASSNTVAQSYFYSAASDASDFVAGSNGNLVSQSTFSTATAWKSALFLSGSSSNTVAGSVLSSPNGWGLALGSASNNKISQSLISCNSGGGGQYAVWIGANGNGSSSNLITQSTLSNPAGTAVHLQSGSNFNTISQSTITGGGGFNGAELFASSFTALVADYVQSSTGVAIFGSTSTLVAGSTVAATAAAGNALYLGGTSVGLRVSSSTILGRSAGLYLDQYNAGTIVLSTNVVPAGAQIGIYVATQSAGTQVWITSNTISPTVTASLDTVGLYLNGLVTGATVQQNNFYYRTSASNAGRTSFALNAQSAAGLRIDHNRIDEPGQITGGAFVAAFFNGTTNTTFKFNDVSATGSGLAAAAFLQWAASANNVVKDNVFYNGLSAGSAVNTLNVVDAASTAGFFSDYNDVFISGGGAAVGSWSGGPSQSTLAAWQSACVQDSSSISADPLWPNVAAGSEDFHPKTAAANGRYDQTTGLFDLTDTATSPTIDAADPAEPSSNEPASNGIRANQGSYGNTQQASKTPLLPGCDVEYTAGPGFFGSISAAVFQIKTDYAAGLTLNPCVVIRSAGPDSGLWSEQVDIRGITSNNHVLTIMGAPNLLPRAVVNPGGATTAGFVVANASVTVFNLDIKPAGGSVPYGIIASSANVRISSVNVDSGGNITSAGVYISSWTTLVLTSVTVQNAHGLEIVGSGASVANSTASANTLNAYGLYLNGSSSGTYSNVYAANQQGDGALFYSANSNTVSQSTVTGSVTMVTNRGLHLAAGSSNNSITASVLNGNNGGGVVLDGGASFNSVSQSSLLSSYPCVNCGAGLIINAASSNTFIGDFIGNDNANAAILGAGAVGNLIQSSTLKSLSAFAPGYATVELRGSSNTIAQSVLWNVAGNVVNIDTGAANNLISQSTLTAAGAGAGIFIGLANGNAVIQSSITSLGGYGAYINNGQFNSIGLSSITETAAGIPGLVVARSSFTSLVNDYVQGSTAVYITGSTGTAVGGSVLAGASPGASGLDLTGGSVGLSLSSSVVTTAAGANGFGAFLDAGNGGLIVISTNVFLSGPQTGIYAYGQTPGTQIWVTSNTILGAISPAYNTTGLTFNGLTSGATVEFNSIYWRASGAAGANGVYGMYFAGSKGLAVDHNRINQPGMLTTGSFYGAQFLLGTTNSSFKFNDVSSSGTALSNAFLLEMLTGSTGNQVRDNVFFSSFSAPSLSSATILVDAASVTGFNANFNDFFSSNSLTTGICNGVAAQLPNWTCNGAQDANSISANPLWQSMQGGSEDFHPLSKVGRCTNSPSCTTFANDGLTSPTIDAADPADGFASESAPNGGRANMGSYGGTLDASKSPTAPGTPSLLSITSTTANVAYGFVAGVPPDFYQVDASTAANFTGTIFSSKTASSVLTALVPFGLSANTTYFLRVESLWNPGTTVYNTTTISSSTLSDTPSVAAFSAILSTAIKASWGPSANPAGTTYYLEVSTTGAFNGVFTTSATLNLFVSTAVLLPNTTYTFQVAAFNNTGALSPFASLGSTSTLAVPPGPAASTFTAVGSGSLTLNWSSCSVTGPCNPAGTYYLAQVSSGSFPNSFAGNQSSTTLNLLASFTGLLNQTTYYAQVVAVNNNNVPSAFTTYGSTQTSPAPPGAPPAPFAPVYASSLTVNWLTGGNAPGTTWYAQLAADAGFTAILASSQTYNIFAGFTGLSANTTYFARSAAYNANTSTWTAFTALGSTPTLALPPIPAASTFTAVNLTSITAVWQNPGDPAGTLYVLQASTAANFTGMVASSVTYNLAASNAGLSVNTTYYFQAAAINFAGVPSGFIPLGSTSTLAAAPVISSPTVISSTAVLINLNANGNPTGTTYLLYASTAPNPLAPAGAAVTITSNTFAAAISTAGLTAATTFYFTAVALNNNAIASAFAAVTSTMTLPSQPAPSFVSAQASSICVQWTSGGNPAGTSYLARVSTDNFATVNASTLTTALSAVFGAAGAGPALLPNTSYFFSITSLDASGAAPAPVISTATLAAAPAAAGVTFVFVSSSLVTAAWSPNGNPLNLTTYTVVFSTGAGFPNANAGNVVLATAPAGSYPSATVNNLLGLTTYYLFVSAVNYDSVSSTFSALGSTLTATFSAPVITDNQAGDAAWRNASAVYNVTFNDFSGSHLSKFSVEASTMPGGTGPFLIGFTDVVTNINADSYVTPWALPAAVFNALLEGPTNYITVKATNGLGTATAKVDAFFVKKDTTAPNFANGAAGGVLLPVTGPGTFYPVQAFDATSGLAAFQYSVSANRGSGDASLIGWSDIGVVAGSTFSVASWQVAFAGLSSLTTNYVSVRAWDVAGTTSTLVDAFFILKTTAGPSVGITAPLQPVLSSLSTISGTAAGPLPIKGVEVNIQKNPPTGNYWDGISNFTSPTPVWLVPSSTASWTLAPAGLSAALLNGTTYQIVARSSDTSNVYCVPYSTVTFLMALSTPTAGVTSPATGANAPAPLTSIAGTAADAFAGAGLSLTAQVSLRRLSDNRWWNFFADVWGSSTVVVSSGVPTAGPATAASWIFLPDSALQANLASGASYFVGVAGADNAFPQSHVGSLFAQGSTFTFSDTTTPAPISDLAGSTGPAPGQINLTWHATGDNGMTGTILSGQYAIGASTYSAFPFSTSTALTIFSTSTPAGAGQAYTLIGLNPGVTYYVHVFLADTAGNWSTLSNAATAQAQPPPANQIQGHVVNLSTIGITGVRIDAFDSGGVPRATTYSLADGSGTYALSGLAAGFYKIQATYAVNGLVNSVWIDGIPMGSVGIDFVLNLTYTLGGLTGTLSASAGALRAASALSSVNALSSASASRPSGGAAFVELWSQGQPTNRAFPQAGGQWQIPNLLPGPYSVRAFNGLSYTPLLPVTVREGEMLNVVFAFDPLPENSVYVFPNPARTQATFRFETALQPLDADLSIFDAAGNLIKEIPGPQITAAGPTLYHAVWDLTNSRGSSVASGVYLYMIKVRGGPGNQTTKVVKKVAVVR